MPNTFITDETESGCLSLSLLAMARILFDSVSKKTEQKRQYMRFSLMAATTDAK
jgi:hypothetical protein